MHFVKSVKSIVWHSNRISFWLPIELNGFLYTLHIPNWHYQDVATFAVWKILLPYQRNYLWKTARQGIPIQNGFSNMVASAILINKLDEMTEEFSTLRTLKSLLSRFEFFVCCFSFAVQKWFFVYNFKVRGCAVNAVIEDWKLSLFFKS